MSILKIYFFGRIRVYWSDSPNELNLSTVLKSLLAFLVLHRHRSFQRDTLTEKFWGNVEDGRASSCLSTALWRLRSAIEPDGVAKGSYLLTDRQGHEIRFNPDSDFWLDTIEFERQAHYMKHNPVEMQPNNLKELEDVLMLYDTGFLSGNYDDWALREHERYYDMYISILSYLIAYYSEKRDFAKGTYYGRLLLEKDPLREDIHRVLMSLYIENGQRALAIRQYHQCKHILKTELEIDPDEQTHMLFNEITANDFQSKQKRTAREILHESTDLQDIAELFEQTRKTIDNLQTLLQLMASRFDKYPTISD